MLFNKKLNGDLLKKLTLQAARIPAIYLTLGIILTALSFIDDIIPITKWKNLFDFTDKAGSILIALSGLTFVYNFSVYMFIQYEKKIEDKHKVGSVVVASLRKSLRVIMILVAINIIISTLEPTRFLSLVANNLVNTIIIISIGWIAIQILYTVELAIYQHMKTLSREEHTRVQTLYTKMHVLRNIATVVIAIITIAAVLMSFSSFRNVGISLLASAGFLTAIIGLSAQKTLFSLFSGIQIVLSHPIKIGDIVVIENESGIIEEITFTYVTLKLGDRRRMIVPINYFIEKPFENWSRESDSLRSSLHFNIDFMMPIEPLRDALDNILTHSPFWDNQAKKLQVSNLTDRSVQIRIQISAANADDLSDLRAEVREKMLNFMREHYPEYFPKLRFNNGDADAMQS